ncbi:Outer membrane protein transport protein (OMPP1/FadL/TodX) [Sphingomonas paucimobilis]|nr:Outer membrane protein transport protein (OMPP1/FadL/TodX) [Sphingomonas paucimobilis]
MQLHNDWATVGISYKSRIKHQLKGSLEVGGLLGPLAGQNRTVDGATAEFYTPAQIIVAGRFRATDKLTLNAQAVRFTWADFDAIRLGAPINTAIPENYKNSFSLAGGFDYAANDRLTLRAGCSAASPRPRTAIATRACPMRTAGTTRSAARTR